MIDGRSPVALAALDLCGQPRGRGSHLLFRGRQTLAGHGEPVRLLCQPSINRCQLSLFSDKSSHVGGKQDAGFGPARICPENVSTKFVPGVPLPAPSSSTPVELVSPLGAVPITVS